MATSTSALKDNFLAGNITFAARNTGKISRVIFCAVNVRENLDLLVSNTRKLGMFGRASQRSTTDFYLDNYSVKNALKKMFVVCVLIVARSLTKNACVTVRLGKILR